MRVCATQEFRCPAKQNSTSWCVPRMTSWINQMASYIRSIDGNHMARTQPKPKTLNPHRERALQPSSALPQGCCLLAKTFIIGVDCQTLCSDAQRPQIG